MAVHIHDTVSGSVSVRCQRHGEPEPNRQWAIVAGRVCKRCSVNRRSFKNFLLLIFLWTKEIHLKVVCTEFLAVANGKIGKQSERETCQKY